MQRNRHDEQVVSRTLPAANGAHAAGIGTRSHPCPDYGGGVRLDSRSRRRAAQRRAKNE